MVLFAFVAPARAGAGDSVSDCDCPKLTCNFQCEYEQSVTFYSEKCGPGGSKVKSCARPTCIPLPSAPPSCSAANMTNAAPTREVASVTVKEDSRAVDVEVVGEVTALEGQAWLFQEVEKLPLAKGRSLRESEKVATGDKSKLEITFKDGNSITLTPNSVLVISQVNFNEDIRKRNTLLNLMKGKVRSKVGAKYLGNDESHFRVRTRAAVAGVRGTDFIMTLDQINNDLVAKVDTMSGEVELVSPLKKHRAVIGEKQTATYVAKGLANVGAVSDEIEAEFASRGKMSEITPLNEEQVEWIEKETTVHFAAASSSRKPESEEPDICSEPAGKFNQCSWTCENNPKGETTCRTDLPGTNCVRRVCNANGAWAAPMRLPAAFGSYCDPAKVHVSGCHHPF